MHAHMEMQGCAAHLPVDGALERDEVVEHAVFQEIHHALIAPDTVAPPNGGPAHILM